MFIDIHNGCLGNGGNDIINHSAAHHFFNVLDCAIKSARLHEVCNSGAFLLLVLVL